MEVQSSFGSQNSTSAPPPSMDPARRGSVPGTPALLQNLLSIDDFEKQHEAAVAAAAASRAQSTPKSNPQPGSAAAVPQPIPISTRSSVNTQLFFQRCQALAILQPAFSFDGDASLPAWSCTLTLHAGGQAHSLTTTGVCTSKKEAKEAAATLGLGLIAALEAAGTLATPSKATKKRTPTPTLPSSSTTTPTEPDEPQENYIGILTEFCQGAKLPASVFAEFRTGTCFSAELALESHRPGAPFGGRGVLHSSKKAARAAAAKEAVLWLREKGQLPAVHEPAAARKRKAAASSEDAVQLSAGGASGGSAARVLALAAELGLPQPVYRWAEASELAPGLWTVSSLFPGSVGVGGEHGVVATARHVFGKKAAREECARLTAVELEGVLERRRGLVGRVLGVKRVEKEKGSGDGEGKGEVEIGEGGEDEEYHSC
ncbi:uncharacterized protein BDZ99DRAFT_496000 [Mytilinidion resinicola]|uniref:DRBM domain-containing protein n=1 Tax=Mytilinidion resinicola TaxID=574789 RepID=A0A6A6YY30_9PEZI|nr:uncharacterized protein BDZ99DRAFT_496000 [Mytilinidion resinicola]KAF2812847.1 hypothetical protein BDZ99DRAFT_496000 [Mytilinidion resinicola]